MNKSTTMHNVYLMFLYFLFLWCLNLAFVVHIFSLCLPCFFGLCQCQVGKLDCFFIQGPFCSFFVYDTLCCFLVCLFVFCSPRNLLAASWRTCPFEFTSLVNFKILCSWICSLALLYFSLNCLNCVANFEWIHFRQLLRTLHLQQTSVTMYLICLDDLYTVLWNAAGMICLPGLLFS